MIDERSLYVNQLLRNYKQGSIVESQSTYTTVTYRFLNDGKEHYRIFGHDEGIDFVIQYIKDLEKKINELQYIDRIIKEAKRET